MKMKVFSCFASLAATMLWADGLAPVGWRETGGTNVASGATLSVTDPLVVGDRGTFVKTGAGTLFVPAAALDRTTASARYVVMEGTLSISDGEAAAASTAVPSVLTEKAAFWASAHSDSAATITLDGDGYVSRWHDVRETDVSSPTRPYMAHACVSGLTDQQQTKESFLGHDAVYFGGYSARGKGGYMQLTSADGSSTSFQYVFNVFFVHGVSNCWGTVIGHTAHPCDFMNSASIVSVGDSGVKGYYYTRADTMGAMCAARHYRNGALFDPSSSYVMPDTFELIDADFVQNATAFSTFYNCRSASNRQGGDFLSEAIVFTNRLTEAERLEVERYLIAKWGLPGDDGQPLKLGVAGNATLELSTSSDMAWSNDWACVLYGEGAVRKTGSGRLCVAPGMFADFNGTFTLSEGTLFSEFNEFPVLTPEDGYIYAAELQQVAYKPSHVRFCENGTLLSRTSAAAGTIAKTGVEALAFGSVPAATKRLEVNAGTLSLAGRSDVTRYATNAAISATFANPGAEKVEYDQSTVTGNRGRKTIASGNTLDGWTAVSENSFNCGYLLGPLIPYYSSYRWSSEIQEGKQAFYFFSNDGKSTGSATLYTTVNFPAAGDYLVSWRESLSSFGYSMPCAYSVIFGDTYETAEVVDQRIPADNGFPRVYMTLHVPSAGDYCFGFSTSEPYGYYAMMFDDLRADYRVRGASAGIVEIPNGDFEQVTTNGAPSGTLTVLKSDVDHQNVLSAENGFSGWTLNQGDGWHDSWSGVSGAVVTVVSPAINVHNTQGSANGVNNAYRTYARLGDETCGTFHLFMCRPTAYGQNSYAQTTFTVAEPGTYRLRGKVAKRNINYAGVDYLGMNGETPCVKATVAVDGTTTDLGGVTSDSMYLAEKVWTNSSFTVSSSNASVTLTLRQTTSKAGCLVDDLVLVKDGTPALEFGEELVFNGSFEQYSGANSGGDVYGVKGWSATANPDVSTQSVSYWRKATPNGGQYTWRPYDGEVVCCIRGASTLSQPLPWMDAGTYRFRFAGNTRYTPGYDENGVRITLNDASGNEVYEICSISEITNVEAAVRCTTFNVTASGRYTLMVTGTQAETRTGDRCCAIDGLSLQRVSGTKAPPSLPSKLRISVAEGAVLDLDFEGTVKTGPVSLGTRTVAGVVNAASYPDFITGSGSLEAVSDGAIIIIR